MPSLFQKLSQLALAMEEDNKPKEPTIVEKMMGVEKPQDGLMDVPADKKSEEKEKPKSGWGWGKKPKEDEDKK